MLSTGTALGLIAVFSLASLITASWSLILHLIRKPQVSTAELEQQVASVRLEVAELLEKFTAQQKRAAVRAMRERADEREMQVPTVDNDPVSVKRRLREQAFGGGI
jgi:hypothetical protein